MSAFYGDLDMYGNALQNAALHPSPVAPANPTTGQVYWNTATNQLLIWDGTVWVTISGGAAAALFYRHVQSSAAATWTIPHNLTFRPNVAAVDSAGREIWPGATDYPDDTTVVLTFSVAVGGEAYCS